MANMEFLYTNAINTTTMISLTSLDGTSTFSYVFDKNTIKKYESTISHSVGAASYFWVTFTSAIIVDRIIIQNTNLKAFNILYDVADAAHFFSLSSNCPTETAAFSGNSATSLYLIISTPKTVTSFIRIHCQSTTDSNPLYIGELWICQHMASLEYNPSAKNYKVKKDRHEIEHKMSDGGTAYYAIQDNFAADIKLDYVSASMTALLEDVHTHWAPIVFVPEPTGTGWNGKIYEVNWVGDWDFEQYSDDYKGNGYEGTIRLRETPR